MNKELVKRLIQEGDILDFSHPDDREKGAVVESHLGPNEIVMAMDGRLYIVNVKEVK